MDKYEIRFSKESGGKLFITTIEADNEKEAFSLAVKEAESKGIELPEEIWTRTRKVTGNELTIK